jgi:hypothetical protein
MPIFSCAATEYIETSELYKLGSNDLQIYDDLNPYLNLRGSDKVGNGRDVNDTAYQNKGLRGS